MNASKFMDKQIMELSRSKSTDHLPTIISNNNNNNDFMDLMNPQSEDEDSNLKKRKDEILASYDFQPINRPNNVNSTTSTSLQSVGPDVSSKPKSSPLPSYNSLNHVDADKIVLEKAQKVNDSAILSEIDRTMKTHIDSVLHAIDGLSARMSQLENRSRHLEHSVDELKVSLGNNHGSTDGKMRHLENILIEVQNGVQDLKDKQEVMEGHMQLAKLQISKVEQSSELSSAIHPDQQTSASAPPQQSGFQQFPVAAPQQVPSLTPNIPSNVPPPPQQNIYPPPGTTQIPPGHTPPGPQRDAYLAPPSQTQEVASQQYQMPPPTQHPQPPHSLPPPPQQYQSTTPTPPYPQPPQHPQHSAVGASTAQFSAPLGHRPEEGLYIPPQTYPPNLHQPAAQPSSIPPHSQSYYGTPPSMYEPPPPTGRSSSGPPPSYGPPSGPPTEPYSYGGPPHYGSASSIKMQPHSPVGNSSNYPQLPTAKILPPAIPTASGISGGSSSSGNGNKVPIDDVVDKVTNMGFPRDHVRATVRKLTENGQSVDLNVVLDKLMNDGDIQPPKGWFNR